MSEELKGKKGKKKISEDFSKAIKKFKKAVSTKPTERSGEPMECELTEAQGVIDVSCSVFIFITMQYNSYCILHACTLCHHNYLDAM